MKIIKLIVKWTVKWIWQLPQNLIGFALTRTNVKIYFVGLKKVYIKHHFFNSGVSLGNYIILDETNLNCEDLVTTVKHEYGHQKQSQILGIFYLIIIGLPSILGNLFDRVFHKKWSQKKRDKWYYSQLWENWADKLGDVKR